MYGVVRAYRATDVEELSRLVKDEFIPLVQEVPGFVAYYVIDAGDGKVSSVTICEDKAGVEASTARAADWVKERLSSLIKSGPEVTAGDVIVEHSRVGAST